MLFVRIIFAIFAENNRSMNISLSEFNRFFIDYQERLVRFASTYIRNDAVAEDCVIEAVTSLWLKRESLPDDLDRLAWVVTVVRNKCIDYLRKEQKNYHPDNDDASWAKQERMTALEDLDPKEIFSAEIRQIIDATLNSLPEQTRRIFVLSVYENKRHSEIAKATNLTVAGVEYHIYKAKAALRVALRDYLPSIILFVYFC